MPDKKMSYKIIQFSADGKKIRFAPMALMDGHHVGDLEGVMFEVTVPDGKIQVKATRHTKDYLEDIYSSPKKWENDVLKYVENGADNLQLEDLDNEDWDTTELHLTNKISFYTADLNLTLVETETKEFDCQDEEEMVVDIEPTRQISEKFEPHYCTLCHSKIMVGDGTANFHFDDHEHGEVFLQICRKCSITISLCAC